MSNAVLGYSLCELHVHLWGLSQIGFSDNYHRDRRWRFRACQVEGNLPTFTLSHSHSVTQPHCLTVTLSRSRTVTQPQCHTVTLSHCHAVTLSHSRSVTQPLCLTVTLSRSRTVTQPQCHTVTLSHCHAVTLSHSHSHANTPHTRKHQHMVYLPWLQTRTMVMMCCCTVFIVV